MESRARKVLEMALKVHENENDQEHFTSSKKFSKSRKRENTMDGPVNEIKRKKSQYLVADYLNLYDEGKWDDLEYNINKSFSSIHEIKFNSSSVSTADSDNSAAKAKENLATSENILDDEECRHHVYIPVINENVLDESTKNLMTVLSKNMDNENGSNEPKIITEITVSQSNKHNTILQNNETFSPSAHKNKISRTWNRRNFCLFCRTLVTNFSRHQLRHHVLEQEVRNYVEEKHPDLKERKQRRQAIFDDLRNRGNYLYNSSLREEENSLLPIRRPPGTADVKNVEAYVSCMYCLGSFRRKNFFRHLKTCIKKSDNFDKNDNAASNTTLDSGAVLGMKTRNPVLKSCSLPLLAYQNGSKILREKIFPIMKQDEVSLVAKTDPLIASLASQFLSSHREKKDEYSVTKKMRDAAKLVLNCVNVDPEIKCLADCLKPSKFEVVMEAVQQLSGFNSETGTVSVVGMSSRMAYIIQESAKILSDEAILSNTISKQKKDAIKQEVLDFLQLFKNKFKFRISTNAEKTRKMKNSTKAVVMPDDDDINVLSEKANDLLLSYYKKLSQTVNWDNYENLCKMCIANIIILNRRRPGEVARAQLSHYINRPPTDELTPDVLAALTEDEKNALSQLSLFLVPGKLVRTVPVLLTKNMKTCIDLILTSRQSLDISTDNKLLFARVYTENPFNGSKIIREMRESCLLKKPDFLTATGLRHHLATKSQIYNDDVYTEKICQHLGHTTAIHKQNYRFPIQAMQRGQVGSQLLKLTKSYKDISSTAVSNSRPIDVTVSPGGQINPILSENSDSDSEYCPESPKTSKRKERKRWSLEEKQIVLRNFKEFITAKTNPGKIKCEELIRKNPVLKDRTWSQVNSLVNNIYTNKVKIPPMFKIF